MAKQAARCHKCINKDGTVTYSVWATIGNCKLSAGDVQSFLELVEFVKEHPYSTTNMQTETSEIHS